MTEGSMITDRRLVGSRWPTLLILATGDTVTGVLWKTLARIFPAEPNVPA